MSTNLTCKDCNREFKSIQYLNKHINRKYKCTQVFKCDVCDEVFINNSSLKAHVNRVKKCVPIEIQLKLKTTEVELAKINLKALEKKLNNKIAIATINKDKEIKVEKEKTEQILLSKDRELETEREKTVRVLSKSKEETIREKEKTLRKRITIKARQEEEARIEAERLKAIIDEKQNIIDKFELFVQTIIDTVECYAHDGDLTQAKYRNDDKNDIYQNMLDNTNVFDMSKEIIKLVYASKNNVFYLKQIAEHYIIKQTKNKKGIKPIDYYEGLQKHVEESIGIVLDNIFWKIHYKKLKTTEEIFGNITDFKNIFPELKKNNLKELESYSGFIKKYNEHNSEIKQKKQSLFITSDDEKSDDEEEPISDIVGKFRSHIQKTFTNTINLEL